jgi:SAM-dependent methyltransferase
MVDSPAPLPAPPAAPAPPATSPPSPWVVRWAHLVRPGGTVLDVACGSGRHLRWLATRGFALTGVDRDAAAIEPLRALGEIVVADIENGPWPFGGRRFDAVLVTNYLWRPLMPTLRDALADGGVLICETFARGHERYGRPSRPAFLLEPGELLHIAQGLHVVAYEDGLLDGPPRRVQRIVAVRPEAASTAAGGHPLEASPGR